MAHGNKRGYFGKLIGGGNETANNTSNNEFSSLLSTRNTSSKLSSDYIFMGFFDRKRSLVYK